MLVKKIMPKPRVVLREINPLIQRSKLQTKSALKNLFGSSFNDFDKTMIIPGGMTKFEKLIKASTGNYPQSVMDRWFVKGTGPINAGDYEVRIGSHLSGDPAYDVHPVNPDEITPIDDIDDGLDVDGDDTGDDAVGDDGILEKLIKIFTGEG